MRSLILVLACVVGVLCGCTGTKGESSNGEQTPKLRVVSTIGMIDDAVRTIGGDLVQAEALMGPGVDPHLFRATASDVGKLEKADIVFYLGLDLEGRMAEVFESLASRKTTVAVAEELPKADLLPYPGVSGRFDPHVWFDVQLWKQVVQRIGDALIEKDPTNAATYKANLDAFQKELDALHAEVETKAMAVPEAQRVLVTAHDAFGYFGRRYGFEVHGIQGASTATEAGAGDVRKLADLIASRGVKAIFVETSVPKATIEALQKAVASRGKQVTIGGSLFSDAMGSPDTPEGTYVGMVRHNIDTLTEALK